MSPEFNEKDVLKGSAILLTGSSGLVGEAILRALILTGARVFTVGRTDRNDFCTDLSEGSSLPRLSLVPSIDAVVHAAAAVPNRSSTDHTEFGLNTHRIDRNVAEFVNKRNVRSCYISGTSVYQQSAYYVHEESPKVMEGSAYILAKRDGDRLFSDVGGASILRISTPIGGRVHDGSMLGRFIASSKERGTIEVWGSGAREQNYVHVDDVARFVTLCLARHLVGPYNVTSVEPITSLQLAGKVAAASGAQIIVGRKSDPNEVVYARFSSARARLAGFSSNFCLSRTIKDLIEGWPWKK